MRVIGGDKKGQKLASFKGSSIRPTADQVREAVFNVLEPYSPFNSVLDLFAGTGAVAIEALSRGARSAVLVDRDGGAVSVIKKNIDGCRLGDVTTVMKRDVFDAVRLLAASGSTFDLVYMDPPYSESHLIGKVIRELSSKKVLAPGAVIVAEAASRDAPPDTHATPGVEVLKTKRYGDTAIYFFTAL